MTKRVKVIVDCVSDFYNRGRAERSIEFSYQPKEGDLQGGLIFFYPHPDGTLQVNPHNLDESVKILINEKDSLLPAIIISGGMPRECLKHLGEAHMRGDTYNAPEHERRWLDEFVQKGLAYKWSSYSYNMTYAGEYLYRQLPNVK